jgi:hypothetical protein
MGRHIGAVGCFRDGTIRNNDVLYCRMYRHVGHYATWDILLRVLLTLGTSHSGTFHHVYVLLWDVL